MSRYDFTSHRLFVDAALTAGAKIDLDRNQSNYLLNVLRLQDGAGVLVFNGRDGEWTATLDARARKSAALEARTRSRAQTPHTDVSLVFAPLKHARLDYLVQKAVEMGAGRLVPVITRRTQVRGLNRDRMRANAIEAAEQCGILAVPDIGAETAFEKLIAEWPAERRLVFCDEDAPVRNPIAALAGLTAPAAVIIGPEGGFDPGERDAMLRLPGIVRLSLGDRILRADTAAVAALALVQAVLGGDGGGRS